MEVFPITGDQSTLTTVLINRASEGDEAAFKIIYNLLSPKMYTLCLRYAGNSGDASDFFQEGFIRLYRNLSAFRGDGSFEGWARKVFVTTCLDNIKKRKITHSDISAETERISSGEVSYLDKISYAELLEIIQRLPEQHRTIINLYLIEGYSHKEIAHMYGITESGSKSQLHKARIYIKTKLIHLSEAY